MAIAEGSVSYQAVKRILEKERDIVAARDDAKQFELPLHENIRGQAAYS